MLDKLIRFCAERRLVTLLVTALIAIYGLRSYLETPVEAFPDVTNLQVNVIAQMPGLAPPEIERQITIPLERELNGMPGLMRMRSESLFGLSLIYLTFEDSADPFRSRMLVSERVTRADLPDGVTPELGPDATPLGQIFQYHVVSDRHTLAERRSEQEWVVAPMLRRVPGVADVVSRGGFLKEVHIEVDPARLVALDLTLDEVADAVSRSNRNVGGGFLARGDQQLVVRGVGYFQSAQDVKTVVLKHDQGVAVTVGDVARVVLSHTPRQGAVGYDLDKETVEGVVYLRRGENPSRVLDGVHERVVELNDGILPEGMRIEVFYDRSTLVGLTLKTVHKNLAEAALLVVAVVWLFIRSLRGSLIVAAVIPLSLMVAFIGLYAIGLPANLISMGAIDFGILVDGAVILVESVIHKLRAEQPKDRGAMIRIVVSAAVEVARPTFFAMGIIIAALIPVFSLEQVEGRIFKPLAMTYAFALLGALLFALTAVPALCALLLRAKDALAPEPRFVDWLKDRYRATLELALRFRLATLGVGLGVVGLAALTLTRTGTEFLPELDEGDILVFVEMPSSISLAAGQDILLEVRRRVLEFPEVRDVETQQGRPEDGTDNESVNMAEMPVRLRARDRWRAGWDKPRLEEAIRERLSEIPGVRFNFSQPMKDNVEEAISGVRGKVVLKIFGTDLDVMRSTLQSAVSSLQAVEGIVDLSLYRDRAVPQLEIVVKRDAVARSGLGVGTVQELVETSLAGTVATDLWEGERAVPVRVRYPRLEREDVTRIGQILVPTPTGAHVPLSELAEVRVTPGRASINRESNSRSLALKFNIDGRDMGSVVADAMRVVKDEVDVPEGHYLVWGGEFENQERAMKRLSVIVPLSILVVFGLLWAALGSGRSASAVLLVVPFSVTGGVFALYLTGINLSVSAAVGFIALLGQVSLASLLIVGAADDRLRRGADVRSSLLEGAAARFRAVLMLALLAMLGLTPMAISQGVGSETQKPFAVVLIGGMITTLIVALYVLPVIYSFIAKVRPPAAFGEPDV